MLAAAAAGCGSSDGPTEPAVQPPTATVLAFTSEPGDFIGAGETKRYTYADGTWEAFASGMGANGSGDPVQFYVRFRANGWQERFVDNWTLFARAPQGQTLRVGTRYTGMEHSALGARTAPGFTFDGNARTCGSFSGWFEITDLVLGSDNRVDRARVVFEQHCDRKAPALRGEITIAANPWR